MPKNKENLNADTLVFTRSDVADILGITTMTISNREKSGMYPPPKRDANNYRRYSVTDVINLQIISHNVYHGEPILAALFDKGYRDIKQISKVLETAKKRFSNPTS